LIIDTTFLATSENLWRPTQFFRHEAAEECLDGQPAFLRAQIGAHGLATLRFNGQCVAGFVEVRAQGRQPFVQHQHEEALFGEIGRGVRVKPAGAIFDGIEPVGRDRLTNRKRRPIDGLGRKTFDRIAINGPDRSGFGCH
jgi:hypothetical protein